MPARLPRIASLPPASRLTLDSIAAGVLARLTLGTLVGLAMSALTANSVLAAGADPAWLAREIPPVIEDLLKDDVDTQGLQGLFSPRVVPDARLSLPGGMTGSVTADPRMEAPGDFAADLPEDLPSFPESLLRQAPAELGRIAAPANERKGVPEPVFLKEMWTFSTPIDRITPLKNEFSANGRFVHDLPSTLTRFDHLSAESLPTDHWIESARLQRLPPEALYAVALQESGMRTASGQIQPWPWTLNCNAPCPHGPMRFASKQAASDALEKLLKAGWRNIDIGAMQVNYRAHAKRFASYDLLDPRINVIVGGVILREAVQQAGGNLRAGFGLYHVGVLQSDNASRAQNYANGVMRWAGRLKQPGALNLAKR